LCPCFSPTKVQSAGIRQSSVHKSASMSNTSRRQVLQVRAVAKPAIRLPPVARVSDTWTSHSKRVEAASRSVLKTRRRTLPARGKLRLAVCGSIGVGQAMAWRPGTTIQVQAVFGPQGLLKLYSTSPGAILSFICLIPASLLPATKRTLCKDRVLRFCKPLAPSSIHTHCPARDSSARAVAT
jgi:hypothetical protein